MRIFRGADDGNVTGSRCFHAKVGTVMIVHADFATLFAAAPRREGTLEKTNLSPIAKVLQEELKAACAKFARLATQPALLLAHDQLASHDPDTWFHACEVFGQSLRGLRVRVLNHIRRVDAAAQSSIHSQRYGASQPCAMTRQQLA